MGLHFVLALAHKFFDPNTASYRSNESTKVHNARRVHKVVTESDVANVEIISWNCIIILHVLNL